jgi:hypothetical protein
MGISSIVSRIVPAAIGFATGGPIGATTAAIATEKTKRQEKIIKRENARLEQEYKMLMDPGPQSFLRGGADPYASQLVVNRNNNVDTGGFFGTLRSGLREVGGFVQDAFSSGIPQLFGLNRPASAGQQPAMTTITNVGAQETQGSGSIQAGAGVLPSVLGAARGLLKNPGGQLTLGAGIGSALGLFGSDGQKMRITRKMKSQARTVVNITGGNLSAAADLLNISEDMLVAILLKRFRNDGPVVTKAALRKTKQTVRRLKSMCDMYDSLRPAATRRKAPMRRASTTLISNK